MTYQEGRIGCVQCYTNRLKLLDSKEPGPWNVQGLTSGELVKLAFDGMVMATSGLHHIRGELEGERKLAVEAALDNCSYCWPLEDGFEPHIAKTVSPWIRLNEGKYSLLKGLGIDTKPFYRAKRIERIYGVKGAIDRGYKD